MVRLLALFIVFALVLNISFSCINNVSAQNSTSSESSSISNENLLLLNLNLNRIETQLNILLDKVNGNNNSFLFEHAYIPHSVVYPSIKPVAIMLDSNLASSLEANLTDIGINSRTSPDSPILHSEIINSINLVNDFYSKLKDALPAQDFSILEAQTMSYLLRDAYNSYGIYLNTSKLTDPEAANFATMDYENTLGLLNQSSEIFEIIKLNMTDTKSKEVEYFVSSLNTLVESESEDTAEFMRLVSAIENDLNESNNIRLQSFPGAVDPALQSYYDNIDTLLNNALSSLQNGDYVAADKNVSSAYLDNFEYLEAPIEEVNSTLMLQIETNMRENLRDMIQNQTSLPVIEAYITDIKADLEVSKQLLSSSSSGVDPALQSYYDNIDTLLNNALSSLQNGDYVAADKNVSSAYLDNFEYLEAPIEEVNSTLMLQIETNMRENLRDMIQNQTSLPVIEAYITDIKADLEVSKQLLSSSSNPSGANPGNLTLPSAFVSNTANIDSLKQGFGVYTGERRVMGNATEDFKNQVRDDIDTIRIKLDQVITVYNQNDTSDALATARSAYLDSYENIEIPLRPIDPDFTLEMEIKFAELRNLISSNAPSDQVVSKVYELKTGLDESERFVSGIGVVAPVIAFSSSFSIIFREGLESALIIGAILTYLEASRNEKFKKHVYAGIVLAIGLTVVTWLIAEFLIEISGAQRELIEAIAGISAVAVLFWVSFWVLNKIETKKWIEFVKAKVWQATATGSFMVFILLAFFTVYREGFETVLFYQALFSFAKYMELYVLAGMVLGLAIIIAVVFIIRKLGKKLPLRVLFGLTMGVGAFMSITFLGNALREFQELGWLSTTHLFGIIPRLDINIATMTGIHPTLETVVGQLILLAIYVVGSLYILFIQPRRQQKIASMRKSVANKEKGEATAGNKGTPPTPDKKKKT
ncbi:FTR1 family protein [Candidatus Nitrosocosmicus sp. FF01]|uniref:FTR1 family iron permease n=1 Tax=Candidatus Nitrosocosmicus sp. FF01 TaxID=3397670 RepID=UPI0039EC3508